MLLLPIFSNGHLYPHSFPLFQFKGILDSEVPLKGLLTSGMGQPKYQV